MQSALLIRLLPRQPVRPLRLPGRIQKRYTSKADAAQAAAQHIGAVVGRCARDIINAAWRTNARNAATARESIIPLSTPSTTLELSRRPVPGGRRLVHVPEHRSSFNVRIRNQARTGKKGNI